MIGIFGGTFDPIHNGHLRIALDAQEALSLSEVRFIPLHQAVHRDQPIGSPEQRLAMLNIAIKPHQHLTIDPREITRKGASYMVDTLQSLAEDLPQQPLCLLLGSDAFQGFMQWKSPHKILDLANILVMQRPNYSMPENPELLSIINNHQYDIDTFKKSQSSAIHFHPVTQLDISSSDIRQRRKTDNSLHYLLPEAVIDYIETENLYAK